MKILIVTTECGPDGGGMSLSCFKIKNILSKEHTVYVSNSMDFPIKTAKGGFNPALESHIRKECKLKSDQIKYKDIDVVLGFGGGYNGFYASLLAERIGKRYVLSLRGSDVNLAKWSNEDSWYLAEASRRASNIICLSEEMVDNVLSLYSKAYGKMSIIPNPYLGEWRKVSFPNLPLAVKMGCAAAHLNEKKGIANLLNFVSEYKRIATIPLMLELVGDIDEDLMSNYSDIIDTLGITDDVKFISRKSREELKTIMSQWDFYIQASVCEGHPNSIIEGLQDGLAFISSGTGHVAELLQKDFPQIFFKSWEPHDMAISLSNLIIDKDIKSLYDIAQARLKEHCEYERISKEWLNLFSYVETDYEDLTVEHVHTVALHDVQGDIHDSITTPIAVFENFVRFIKRRGYELCSMKKYLESGIEMRRHMIVCTFDDGYSSLADHVAPILSDFGFNATVFVCTGLIGKNNSWNNKDGKFRAHLSLTEIKKLVENGWEIASHGVTHRNLLKLSDVEVEEELSKSKVFLDGLVGYSSTYAYPYGAYNSYIQHCVEKYYKYAFAVSQGGTSIQVDKYQLRRYSISEIYNLLQS